ncbi:23S rRNA (pseudouridine(1915)-N(3))-methyltransferase RlmH [Helicobacter cynogastricus]|uniref:23S rRNA (pseudouridine(1915)-N(3))-methyltransferase RlmH n=1 Tax=Helicobacter cynogastricus TaxID=329937 RepID=UPI000CF16859|nr:23S rRNA (pseudouridine(1915)-N(3))-methyltransferase RlmH [Helicobacter cynogastricus]
MTYHIYAIAKPNPQIAPLVAHYQRQCQQFGAQLNLTDLNPSKHNNPASYTKTLSPYLKPSALLLALHPAGKSCSSQKFSQLLSTHARIHFFIGGAFGFEEAFLRHCQPLSLSALTLSHEIAKLVLCEQIFRGLSLLHNHPYHK